MMTNNDTQPAALPPDMDWVSLARDAYTASSTYFDANIRHQVEADLRQAQGIHPTGSKYLADKSRSRLFRPKTRATIRKNEAACAEAFFTTNDVVSIKPENDNDPIQQASAGVLGELLQYRLTKSIPWYLTLMGAYQDAQTVGIVASYQYWEYNQRKGVDKPAVRLIPVENLRFDPGALWTDPVNTSPYVIELIPMYVGQVKARMRNVDPKTGEAKWKYLPDSTIATATNAYGDTIRLQREGVRMDPKAQTQANSNFNIAWVHKIIVEVEEVDYVYYTLGTEYLLSDPVPLEQKYFHGRRPYVVGTCILETHKNYPSSLPNLTHDVQAEINEVTNQRIDNVKLALNKRYFARRNKQVDLRSVTRNVPGSVTLMSDIDDVKVVEFADVTQSSYKEQEMLNLDFDDVAGAFSGASVQSNRKLNETVGGMNLLDAGANQVSNYQLRTFVETWVEPVLRQIVLLEQFYETDDLLLGLCGRSAQIMQRFGVDAVTDELLMQECTLNVNVGMGQTNPVQQAQQFVQAMTALRDLLADGSLVKMGLDVNEVIKEIFGKYGYKDGGRFFDTQKQDPVQMALQSQIDQLTQQLQAKMDPKLVDATVAKVNAETAKITADAAAVKAQTVKTGVEAAFSAMQSAEVIAAVPAVAPIADQVMKSAGYVPPAPAGTEPGYPEPQGAADGLGIKDVTNKRTGIGFMPGDGTMPAQIAGGAPTTVQPPPPPQPATPGIGVRHGIETTRPDSIAGQAFADGGLIGDPQPFGRVPMNQAEAVNVLGRHNGRFINADGLPDNLASYNLSAYGIDGPNAMTSSPIHDMLAGSNFNTGALDSGGTVHSLLAGSAFRFADGGLIQGAGDGTSDSVAGVANGQPVALSNGEYRIPAAVVQALGADWFEELVARLHAPAEQQPGAMPVSNNPVPLENGDFIVPADVVQALGRDFFDQLVEQLGGQPA